MQLDCCYQYLLQRFIPHILQHRLSILYSARAVVTGEGKVPVW